MQKLGAEIIERYKPYQNSHTKWKKHQLGQYQVQIDEDYQIAMDAEHSYGYYDFKIYFCAIYKPDPTVQKCLWFNKIKDAFSNRYFGRIFLRELKIMRLLKQHDNLDLIKSVVLPRSREQFKDLYFIKEFTDATLKAIIQATNIELGHEHIQFFLYQILRGVLYLHSANVVHRNLRPSQIVVKSNCDLFISDLISARPLFNHAKTVEISSYYSFRWYRAPQDFFYPDNYAKPMDIWSIGCIFAEMLQRKPLFKGKDTKQQLELILEYISAQDLYSSNGYQEEKKFIKSHFAKQTAPAPLKELSDLFPNLNSDGLDLLKKMLVLSPEKRISVQQAIAHPYFGELHLQSDQPTTQPLDYEQFEFEQRILTIQQLKDMIYQEILHYHFDDFKQKHQQKKANHQSLISHIINSSNAQLIHPEEY